MRLNEADECLKLENLQEMRPKTQTLISLTRPQPTHISLSPPSTLTLQLCITKYNVSKFQ